MNNVRKMNKAISVFLIQLSEFGIPVFQCPASPFSKMLTIGYSHYSHYHSYHFATPWPCPRQIIINNITVGPYLYWTP